MDQSKKSFIANIGGTFIYSRNPEKLAEWYSEYFGMDYEQSEENNAYYTSLYYKDIKTGKKSYIVWSILLNKKRPDVKHKVFCINYRVHNLEKFVKHLKQKGLKVKGIVDYPEGKFAWVKDLDGNPVELWEDTTL